MKKISVAKLEEIMKNFNSKNPEKQDEACISGVIVYEKSNFSKDFSLEARSYRIYNNNRKFQEGKCANSLFGCSLDGTDINVRLDWYRWVPEYCYYEGEVEYDKGIQ